MTLLTFWGSLPFTLGVSFGDMVKPSALALLRQELSGLLKSSELLVIRYVQVMQLLPETDLSH